MEEKHIVAHCSALWVCSVLLNGAYFNMKIKIFLIKILEFLRKLAKKLLKMKKIFITVMFKHKVQFNDSNSVLYRLLYKTISH